MKKILMLLLTMVLSVSLVACGSSDGDTEQKDQVQETTGMEETKKEPEKVEKEFKTEEEYEQSFVGRLKEGDEVISISLDKEKSAISITMALGESDKIPMDIVAISTYSFITDELLAFDELNVFTVIFEGVGEITMYASQAVTESIGTYFPGESVDARFEKY